MSMSSKGMVWPSTYPRWRQNGQSEWYKEQSQWGHVVVGSGMGSSSGLYPPCFDRTS